MKQREALGTNDPKLYGGHAEWFARTKCPECGREYILWLTPHMKSYRVLTMSAVETAEPEAETPEQEPVKPVFDIETADRDQLRAYLKERGVKFFNGASEEMLRDLARGTLALA